MATIDKLHSPAQMTEHKAVTLAKMLNVEAKKLGDNWTYRARMSQTSWHWNVQVMDEHGDQVGTL